MPDNYKKRIRINRKLAFEHEITYEVADSLKSDWASLELQLIAFDSIGIRLNQKNLIEKRLHDIGAIFYKEGFVLCIDVVEGQKQYVLLPLTLMVERNKAWIHLKNWSRTAEGVSNDLKEQIGELAKTIADEHLFLELNRYIGCCESHGNFCYFEQERTLIAQIKDLSPTEIELLGAFNDFLSYLIQHEMDPMEKLKETRHDKAE